jgi:hypothetical protein
MSVSLVWGSTLEKAQAGALTQESARSSFVLPPGGLRQGYGSQYQQVSVTQGATLAT